MMMISFVELYVSVCVKCRPT